MQGMVHLDRQGGKVIDRQLIGNAIVDVHGIEKYVWVKEGVNSPAANTTRFFTWRRPRPNGGSP